MQHWHYACKDVSEIPQWRRALIIDSEEADADGSDAKATAAAVFTFGAAVAFVWALPFGAGSPSITS